MECKDWAIERRKGHVTTIKLCKNKYNHFYDEVKQKSLLVKWIILDFWWIYELT